MSYYSVTEDCLMTKAQSSQMLDDGIKTMVVCLSIWENILHSAFRIQHYGNGSGSCYCKFSMG